MSSQFSCPREPVDLRHDAGYSFLKPGYTDILPDIADDFRHHGLVVAHHRLVLPLPRNVIEYIYSDSSGEHFYPEMLRYLGEQAIRSMLILRAPGTTGRLSVQDTISALKKGVAGFPNLREKYHRPEDKVADPDFELWRRGQHPDQAHITHKVTQRNVFHASDGPHDAIGTLHRLRGGIPDYFGTAEDANTDPRVSTVAHQLDKIRERHYSERDMSKIIRTWSVINKEPAIDSECPLRQVYIWLLTTDEHVVIVSKDGENWQLPGGKPDPNESPTETAVRESLEETGLDINGFRNKVRFFGEYTVVDLEGEPQSPWVYRQARSYLRLPLRSDELRLSTAGESRSQRPEDSVRFVKSVPTQEITQHIPWMSRTDEYKSLKRNRIIQDPVL